LGNLIRLKDLDTKRFYSGGLETDGSAGEFTLLWFDGIIQVVFHVATMMPIKEENCNSKKKHIGNDSTIIVYNESGEEYQFNMIKVKVNFYYKNSEFRKLI
jgi:tuberous sclerosis protein 2